LKILKLQAENVKRLKAIEITPQDNTVIISGRNAQGKSSILDAIWFALKGADASKENVKPIRDGEDHASVTLDLGEIRVTRKWTANDKSYLQVESAEGAVFKSPQAMLDKLVGSLSFDPLEFSRKDSKTQLQTLLGLVQLPKSPTLLDEQKKQLYDERTVVGRVVKQQEALLASYGIPDPSLPAEEISTADVAKEMQDAEKANALIREAKQDVEKHREYVASLERRLQDIEGQIVELKQQQANLADAITSSRQDLHLKEKQVQNMALIDTDAIYQKLISAEEINKNVRMVKERKNVENSLESAKGEQARLSNQIATIDQEKADMLKAAAFPVDGLGFDESGVIYNGIPFKQCSSAEQLRVSLAMAMALNPKLRVIRITDGSLLDADGMRIVEEMAKDKDFQVWLECVNDSGEVGIYIEDGEIAKVNGVA
jgi:DNA repair exonuclease SbcCD ATPase subunit